MLLRISVVIPVYNAESFVTRAVESALGQTEVEEVILIEDGSSDNSLAICQGLVLADTRVMLFQHPGQRNNGAAASRNLGMQKSSLPYIAFLDADDYYLADRFLQTKSVFEEQADADGVYEPTERIYENENAKAAYLNLYNERSIIALDRTVSPTQLFQLLLLGSDGWFHLNGLVIKKAILDKVNGFDLQLRQTQDTDFILRLALFGQLYSGDSKLPVAKINIHGKNRILDEQKVIHYRHLFFKKWFRGVLKNQWSGKVNKHIIRGFLYTHPVIFRYRKFLLIRFPIKAICILGYIIRSPRIIFKLF